MDRRLKIVLGLYLAIAVMGAIISIWHPLSGGIQIGMGITAFVFRLDILNNLHRHAHAENQDTGG